MHRIPPPRIGMLTTLASRGACLLAGFTFFLFPVFAEENVTVLVSEKAITVEAEKTSIRRILESLTREAGLVIHSGTSLESRVSVSIDSSSLADAVAHILRDESYLLIVPGEKYDEPATARSHLWVFAVRPRGAADGWSSLPAPTSNTTQDTEWYDYQRLANSGVDVDREEAMFSLGEYGGEPSIELLRMGLLDPSHNVRKAAVESLADIGGNESIAALRIVLTDPEASVRITAIDALGEIGGKEPKRLIEQALADTDKRVREVAGEWITELNWYRNWSDQSKSKARSVDNDTYVNAGRPDEYFNF
ncbi:MAG: HEAT repeat domain-containing protein [Woeseiaceae bacterium]